MLKRVLAGLGLVLCLFTGAYAADGDPCTANFGNGTVVTPDTDAELCGTTLPYVNTTTTGTVTCAAGSISAVTINMTSSSNWDTSGGGAAICDNSGHCNNFSYTGIAANVISGVTNLSNGGLTTCTGNYASGSSLWPLTTATSLAKRLDVLQDAIQNTQSFSTNNSKASYSARMANPSNSATSYSNLTSDGSVDSSELVTSTTIIPVSGRGARLFCSAGTAPGGGKSFTYTLRNSAITDTTLTCSIADSSVTCSDTTHTPTVTAGMQYSIKVVPAGTPTTSVHNCSLIIIQ